MMVNRFIKGSVSRDFLPEFFLFTVFKFSGPLSQIERFSSTVQCTVSISPRSSSIKCDRSYSPECKTPRNKMCCDCVFKDYILFINYSHVLLTRDFDSAVSCMSIAGARLRGVVCLTNVLIHLFCLNLKISTQSK